MTLTHALSGAAAANGVLFLVELIVKSTLVLSLAALLVLALRRASAAHRHLIWACALIGLVALPWMQLALPRWRVTTPLAGQIAPGFGLLAKTVVPTSEEDVPPADAPVLNTFSPSLANTDAFEKLGGTGKHKIAKPDAGVEPTVTGAAAPDVATGTTGTSATSAQEKPAPSGTPILGWILLVWMIGAFAVLATFIAGHLVLRLMLQGARPVRDGEWQALALEAADRLGLTLPFSLLRADGILVPVASGLLRPRVLLPEGADAWPLELRRAVLLHELAHVQRHDCLTQAIAQVACALFWFHPGVWFAVSRLQIERERACDDRVLAARTRASDYADQLLAMVRTLRAKRLSALGAVAFARPSSLEGRLLAVLDPLRNRRAVGRGAAIAAAFVATLLVLPFAALEPVAAKTTVKGNVGAKSLGEARDPSQLKPSRVVAVPAPEQPLDQRLAWAREDAGKAGARVWWVGWSFETSPSLKGGLLCDSEGIRLEELGRSGWFTMEDILVGRAQGTSDPKRSEAKDDADHRPAMMLIRMESGTPGRVRIQTAELPIDFRGEPLYWVDAVPEEEAFRWLSSAADKAQDVPLRARLVESIGFLGNSDRVVPYLTKTFQTSTSDRVRRGAAEALALHPSSEGVELLSNAAYTDPSPSVRRTSVESLGRFQTQEALEALIAIAGRDEASDGARRAAFDALGQKVSEQAPDQGASSRANDDAKPAPAKSTSPSPKPEAAKFATPEMKAKADKSAAKAVETAPMNEPSQKLAAEDYEVQRQAIESLGRYPEAQSLPRLKTIAETSPNEDLRGQAVESIGRLGSPGALALLDDIAWKNTMQQPRNMAVESMGRRFPPDQALEKLSRVAGTHPDPDTRRAAVEAIGRVDSPRAHEMLAKIVADGGDVEASRQAVESLGRRDEPGVEDELLGIVRSQAPEDVRRQAVESLGRRDGKGISSQLEEIARTNASVEVRREAVESLGRRSEPGTTDLLAKIANEDGPEEVQRQAVETLGRHGDSRTRGLLLEIANKHPNVQVQRQAVESLGRLDNSDAGGDVMADLASIARTHPSGEVRRQAVESMTRRDPEKALPLLEEILSRKK
jgi:HEAT repeat protein/beta-lactamase regulating signal transducer with metallopeptidase domain